MVASRFAIENKLNVW